MPPSGEVNSPLQIQTDPLPQFPTPVFFLPFPVAYKFGLDFHEPEGRAGFDPTIWFLARN